MSNKSLDQVVKWSKWRSWRSDLFEKLHWQKERQQRHMRTDTQSRFYDKLDLEGKQKEELKMAQKCHFNQIVVFHQLY